MNDDGDACQHCGGELIELSTSSGATAISCPYCGSETICGPDPFDNILPPLPWVALSLVFKGATLSANEAVRIQRLFVHLAELSVEDIMSLAAATGVVDLGFYIEFEADRLIAASHSIGLNVRPRAVVSRL